MQNFLPQGLMKSSFVHYLLTKFINFFFTGFSKELGAELSKFHAPVERRAQEAGANKIRTRKQNRSVQRSHQQT